MTTIGSIEDYDRLRKLPAGGYDIVLVHQRTASTSPIPLSSPPDGGMFVWDEYSKEKDDGGTIITPEILRPNLNGRWKRVFKGPMSAKWFGAKGDGVTDDSAALELAASAAQVANADLELPAGTYLVSGPWILSGASRKVIGTGIVTIQRANPQELAKLTAVATAGDTKIMVSSTTNFFKGQTIQIASDASSHLVRKIMTVASVDISLGVVNLTSKLSNTFDPAKLPPGRKIVITPGLPDLNDYDEVIQFDKTVERGILENISVVGIGLLVLGVLRQGISYRGNGSLRCVNVESYNHPQAGVHISSGAGQFSFVDCNFHDNGYAGIYGAPRSVEVIGGNYSNNGPEWSGSSAYGITLNGSKTVITGAKCVNNTGPQIDVHSNVPFPSTLIVQGCILEWGKNNDVLSPGGMVDVSDRCETLIVEGCDMDGSDAATLQFYGVSLGGSQILRTFNEDDGLEVGLNHETIRVVNNVFRNIKSYNAAVYLCPWDAKDIEIIGNTFINCSASISIYNQEQDGCFDPFTPGSRDLRGFDKRKIPDVVRIDQNTIVDSGTCYISCGGIVLLTDNLFIRKYQMPYTISPFFIDSLVGRVGRVIRRNNKVSGLVGATMYNPTTLMPPTNFHWSVGDEENNEAPSSVSFLRSVCIAAGAATDTAIDAKATTYKDKTIIDVSDCTVFCQQQWITVKDTLTGEKVTFSTQPAVRILRVIGLGHRLVDSTGQRDRGAPAGHQGKLIVELPADNDVKGAKIGFQKAAFRLHC